MASSYLKVNENNIEITGWDGSVTLVRSTQEGVFSVEDFNKGAYQFPVTTDMRSSIALPKDVSITNLESAKIDPAIIEGLKGLTPTLQAGLDGMNVVLDQIIVGNFPEFNDDGTYDEEVLDAKTQKVTSVEIKGNQRAMLMLTLAKANGNFLDKDVLVLNGLGSKAKAHLGMIDCDGLPEGAYPPGTSHFPLTYRDNLAGNCRDTKGAGFFSSGKTRAYFACERNGKKVFSQFCYDTGIAFNIPASGSSSADKANIIISLSRAYIDDDSVTDVGQPKELIRFVVPRQPLVTRDNLTIVASFTDTTSASPTVVLVFKPKKPKPK